jgi:hypothetical protein
VPHDQSAMQCCFTVVVWGGRGGGGREGGGGINNNINTPVAKIAVMGLPSSRK